MIPFLVALTPQSKYISVSICRHVFYIYCHEKYYFFPNKNFVNFLLYLKLNIYKEISSDISWKRNFKWHFAKIWLNQITNDRMLEEVLLKSKKDEDNCVKKLNSIQNFQKVEEYISQKNFFINHKEILKFRKLPSLHFKSNENILAYILGSFKNVFQEGFYTI